uniref:Subtilisin-like protease n=1 Tax=Kalanchoe fedtschenkoi TaxID=63787 RepID=A0A7N0TXR3_KALFE
MRASSICSSSSLLQPLLLLLLLAPQLQRPASAVPRSFIVYLGAHSHGPEPTSTDLERATDSHYEFLGSFLGSEKARDAIFYSYNKHINGFAALLEDEEASEIAKHPDIVSVFLNNGRKLHTTRSWDFLGLENDGVIPLESVWTKARFGEDTIIGNLDTGVWPESKSFGDEGLGPVPSKWRGACQDDSHKNRVRCNRKLIGARSFNKGYLAYANTTVNATNNSPRDTEGHGSHTLSTAGGSPVPGASVFGYGNGTARGGSPRARVAAYKVCWPPINGNECFDSDILAAFDAAIHDGVDVLSVSLGGTPSDYLNDGISVGAFHAARKGVSVVCSAGNSGPSEGTVTNLSPWILTVGASTMDREFNSYVQIGNGKHYKGASLSQKSLPASKFYQLIESGSAKLANATLTAAKLCQPGTLDGKKIKGKILLCTRGITARVDKGYQALRAGAVGLILANDKSTGNEIIADPHVLPASHISYTDGLAVFAYVNSTKYPIALLSPVKTLFDTKPAPFMASFSSQGPNNITPEILKPDITAPGVSVIAAFTQVVGPSGQDWDTRRVQYTSQSGTSMSCPHVAGIVGLLKTLHPHWSPAAIKSAIMTSARTRDNVMEPILNSSHVKATPFSYGAGHVRPNRAMDPGLVYDLTPSDYLNFLCALGYNETLIKAFSDAPYTCPKHASLASFNYPAITVPSLNKSVTITRRLKNVGEPGTYTARVKAPAGISVSVVPKRLVFEKVGEEKTFYVLLKAKGKQISVNYVFGELIWSDGKHYVRSPIVVKTR